MKIVRMTKRLKDALAYWREIIGKPDPFPGDRLIATANAAGVLAGAVDAAATHTKPNPSRTKFYRWVVEIEVHETWVEDGFSLDNERAKDMLAQHLQHAHGSELRARVLEAPPRDAVRKAQGG
jgi:hypothetical protein